MRRCNSIPRHSRVRTRGFTLLELMFTLALAGVLLGVGIPSFRTMIANNRLTTETNQFVTAINFARSEAITRNSAVTFCRAAAETDDECETDDEPWNAWIVLNAAGDVLRNGKVTRYGDAIFVTSDLTDQTITFSSDGMARTGGALVANKTFRVCTSQKVDNNFRIMTVGAGSRFSMTKAKDDCP
jgi:type IV fimbrial biogenesis protein FimT